MYNIIGGDGKQYGPVSADQLREWIAQGRAMAETRARVEGTAEWKTLAEFPEFAPLFRSLSTSLPPSQAFAGAGGMPPRVPSYLVPAILCTLFCCLPFGIVAIIYAAKVSSKVSAGDLAGAIDSSRKARRWCWVSFGLGLFGILFSLLVGLLTAQ